MQQIIQQELEKEFIIIDKGSYEVKTPYYNMMLANGKSKDIMEQIYEFPIELRKRVTKIIKLPFNLGRVIWESLK